MDSGQGLKLTVAPAQGSSFCGNQFDSPFELINLISIILSCYCWVVESLKIIIQNAKDHKIYIMHIITYCVS